MNTNQDPMAIGLAVGMARRGGNVTGIWFEGDQVLIGKRLILNPNDPDTDSLKALLAAADDLNLSLRLFLPYEQRWSSKLCSRPRGKRTFMACRPAMPHCLPALAPRSLRWRRAPASLRFKVFGSSPSRVV